MPAPYWLIAVPNQDGADRFRELTGALGSAQDASGEAAVFRFEVPQLRVGTLDRLMEVGDSLAKLDIVTEQLLRKIERQFAEVNLNDDVLTVDGEAIPRYLQRFRWSAAKYPQQRPLDELEGLIRGTVAKVEEELKEATAAFQDKKQAMSLMQRKRGGNLMVGDLREVLTPENCIAADFLDTEYLTTLVVIVPKALELAFLSTYEGLADDSVSYGPEGNREAVRGSPVVPRSATKRFEDKEGYALYTVTVLKLYADAFTNAARERRYIVRDFAFDPDAAGDASEAAASVDVDYNVALRGLVRWCKAHFGEVFSGWVHLKALRAFVESVLRFGLPVNFMSALVLPRKKGVEKKLRDKLAKLYGRLHGAAMLGAGSGEGGKGAKAEFFPYVSFDIATEATVG